jgi:multidrug resistance efflux pump
MSKQIKTMDELTDSRIMYEKKMPFFGYMIVLMLAILIIGIVIWSTFTPKAYMITALGTVTSEKTSFVMPPYTGEIVDCYMREGLIVSKGDVLFTVRSTDYDLQELQLWVRLWSSIWKRCGYISKPLALGVVCTC